MRQAMGEPLKPGDMDHHFIDVYTVKCGETSVPLYFDMYHCDKSAPTTAPSGFSLGTAR